LDEALDYARVSEMAECDTPVPAASLEELNLLAEVLANLDQGGFTMLKKLADLIRVAMGAGGATIVVEGTVANSGDAVVEPILVEAIREADQSAGQITVGPRSRPYSAGDVDKLRHYAKLAGHLLTAAARQRQWRTEAMTDLVSGLYNRRYLTEVLEDLLAQARIERFRVTVVLFDIDDFKSYNDTYGHAAGDEIIRVIAKLFKAHCREHDLVTRYGGDEFCVVFWDADQPRVTGSEHPVDALSVLRRFREALKSHRCESLSPSAQGQLTISGGLASFPWDASTTSELIGRADEALLKAKAAGKNQVFIFDRDHQISATDP
jgi:diguanylate cyclase (GGDEF)-like protein